MTTRIATLLLLLCVVSVAFGANVDPAAAVSHARDHVFAKNYNEAVADLKGAIEAAQTLREADRPQALAAIHFYSAAAYAGLHNDDEAKAHLREFLALSPNARLSAPEKYDLHFVMLFNEMRAPKSEHPEFQFDTYYPGFYSFVAPRSAASDPSAFGATPALAILASPKEKQQWESVQSSSERANFVEDFWKRRDPTPEAPPNEFRETFFQRVAFADRVFGSEGMRGSITDRGKVFVLLGPPAAVRRRPLTERDKVVIYEPNTIINGTVEEWIYGRDQLPMKIKKNSVSFRFVTQRGIGEGVLQREEMYAFQAMMLAMNPNEQKK